MADWSMFDADWPTRPYHYNYPYPYYEYDEKEQPHAQPLPQELSPTLTCTSSPPQQPAMIQAPTNQMMPIPNKITPRGDNPREIRNKAEKQRRDKLNQSIAELAAMVPPVVASCRKIDKTGVLRLTAHYLRAHQYVFDESTPAQHDENFKQSSADCLLGLLNGFLLTTTYRGLMVVVSQNMTKYLGYSEVDLFGQSVFSITHEEDHNMLREQLMPQPHLLGPHGELLVPDEPNGQKMVEEALAKDHRRFIIRFKKHGQRSEPPQYVTCHMEGSFRKSDRACRGFNRSCQFVRRARARSDNPCSSGNDVVFIGVVRPMIQTFVKENQLETFRMEYRTRHLIDGEIIQCEQRIALVTGYMTNEVKGVNAMNFMHKEDVQLVIIALRDMYVKKRLFGESCYRLITKNGQFIYMRTRGCLDVDKQSRSVTTFVCTNTVVGEREGKHLIKLMKKRYAMEAGQIGEIKDEKAQQSEIESLGIKDPRLLEKDILHLVSDLPSCSDTSVTEDNIGGFSHSLELIPPKRERIVSAIEKMYTVFKMFPKEPKMERDPESLSSSLDSLNRSTQTVKFLKPAVPSIIKNPASSKIIKKATSFEDTYMAPHTMQPDYEYNNTTAVIDVENYIFEDKSIQQSNFVKPKQDVNMGFTFTDPRPVTQTATSMAGVKYQRQTGMKRPIETVTCRSILKKKNNTNEDKELAVAGRCSPNFETFLDEAISCEDFLHLDTALASLEQTIDPNFPDLLSNEVQEILEQIEDPVNG